MYFLSENKKQFTTYMLTCQVQRKEINMRITLNAGHFRGVDCGACGFGLQEADVAYEITKGVEKYLNAVGIETVFVHEDELSTITDVANSTNSDLFASIHCNAFNGVAKGTEVCVYSLGGESAKLGQCVQDQIVNSLGTVDRGLKERPGLYVLKHTDMPAILIETAFIDNAEDNALLRDKKDEFAKAIARGVTDYQCL